MVPQAKIDSSYDVQIEWNFIRFCAIIGCYYSWKANFIQICRCHYVLYYLHFLLFLQDYIGCSEIWIEYVVKHFGVSIITSFKLESKTIRMNFITLFKERLYRNMYINGAIVLSPDRTGKNDWSVNGINLTANISLYWVKLASYCIRINYIYSYQQ